MPERTINSKLCSLEKMKQYRVACLYAFTVQNNHSFNIVEHLTFVKFLVHAVSFVKFLLHAVSFVKFLVHAVTSVKFLGYSRVFVLRNEKMAYRSCAQTTPT